MNQNIKKLGDILIIQEKSKIKAGEGIDNGKYPFFTCSNDIVKTYNSAQYKGPALIFGTGGKASVHYCDTHFSTSTDCLIYYPRIPDINLDLVNQYLQTNIYLLENGFKGAGLKHISRDYIANIEINLPNIEIQNNIVQKLNKIKNVISSSKKVLAKYDTLIKSRFIEMFEKEESNWETVTISDICVDSRTGPFGSALHHDEFVESGIFVLGIDNAVQNTFSYNRMRYITKEKYEKLKRYTVYPDDIIITIMGTIGKSAVIPHDLPLAINTKHLACLTVNKKIANPIFIWKAFQIHTKIQTQLKAKTKGAIMDGLNLKIIRNLELQLPPLELQQQFAVFVKQIDKSKFEIADILILDYTICRMFLWRFPVYGKF